MCVDVDVCVQLRVSGRRTNIDHEVPGFFSLLLLQKKQAVKRATVLRKLGSSYPVSPCYTDSTWYSFDAQLVPR